MGTRYTNKNKQLKIDLCSNLQQNKIRKNKSLQNRSWKKKLLKSTDPKKTILLKLYHAATNHL